MLNVRGLLTGTALVLFLSAGSAQAERLKPFVLGDPPEGGHAEAVEATRSALTEAGFEVAGSYSPYDKATVLVVTSEELGKAAAKSTHGGYAAAQRISVTEVDGAQQVSWVDPRYLAAAYRMEDDLSGVHATLEAALGAQKRFGSEKGLERKSLAKYRYMFGMERFDSMSDHLLKEFKSHQEALDAVEAGLASNAGGAQKVYRIDIPGKDESVFGVAITKGDGADKRVMEVADTADVRSTAYLPYEVLVSEGKAYHLFMRYRMALHFPDLTMMTFGKLMSSPKATKRSLTSVVEGRSRE